MQDVLEFLRANPGGWSLMVLFVAAALEVVLPPVPGDSIVLAGSLLVVAGVWPFLVILGTVVAGGFCGSALHYRLGRLLLDPSASLRGGRLIERLLGSHALDRFFEVFRRYGLWVLIFNRAMPGIRGVAFLAAGAAGIPIGPTLTAGLISNVAWSLLLLLLGVHVGGQWERMTAVYQMYKDGALAAALGLGFVLLALRWRKKRTARAKET